MSPRRFDVPSFVNMKQTVQEKFGLSPCTWQLQAAQYQLNSKDVITISPTGSGKTLTFWIPLLFNAGGIIIIVTPLNILGEKNQKEAEALGFPAINLCKETASDQAFKDIEKLKYHVITFTEKIFNIMFDEGHCISEWGADFRPLYSQLGNIRWYLPDHVSVHVVSATMPPHILADVTSMLRIRSHNVARVTRSNNRPNISIIVEEMKFPRNTMHDLTRVLEMRLGDVNPPPKFMIFTNSRISVEMTCNRLWSDVPGHQQGKIVWFHSGMLMEFRVDVMNQLQAGELWGICCTDAAGMGYLRVLERGQQGAAFFDGGILCCRVKLRQGSKRLEQLLASLR
ncbi:P-loop containing nucleoside triphosphate hydrolase protein [Suillus clintonianus]|uniref:P-loop containing nucleoside triphosphate hydrolase protein n=1 Tax=Suillus clintonianus TaxID=1904413 RepID=UPI001B872FA9|nr:P-loop containing nucleoside triphosphate hydrolase protein [Suillus clintonianus]KAG2124813.1 P-loop containing nucleoside triphosphate hydrolase protein [Suillus clintonianus]